MNGSNGDAAGAAAVKAEETSSGPSSKLDHPTTIDPSSEDAASHPTKDTSKNDSSSSHKKMRASSVYSANGTYQHPPRDSFFGFVPQIASWATGIVRHEVGLVSHAVVNAPSWSRDYVGETYEFYKANPRVLYKEIISGFTVAIMQVPESIAFSFVAGVPPLSGLHATFWMATATGLLGGKPGMISGAAGALAVVVADLTKDNGVLSYLTMEERLNVLYMTMVVCGLCQVLFCILRLAQLVRLIPETGMIGFMNGLAIIIFMAQLPAFQKCTAEPLFVQCSLEQREWLTFQDDTWQLILTLVQVAICMVIMKYFPLVPKIGRFVPASLVGLLVGTLLEHALFRPVFGVSTRTVQETAKMSGSLPKFNWPNNFPTDNPKTIQTIIVYGITLAAIGAVESVLTLQACNEITDTVPKIGDSNQELFAQGVGNLVSGLFRAMGGDAMIGQSTINIMNGARFRVSSTSSGIFMLLFVVALSGFIELLPVATLTGVLFMVVLSTFQWKTFMILRYGRLSDSIAIVLVTVIAVFFNLAIAIAVGIIFSALVHAWDSGAHIDADIEEKYMLVNGTECWVKYVHLRGAIFFSSSRQFVNFFNVSRDPDTVIIDLRDALVIDHSAVAAIQGITHRFAQVHKRVLLVNLHVKSKGRLHRTGNHEVLRQQITAEEHIRDVEHGVGSSDDEDNADQGLDGGTGETSAAAAAEASGNQNGSPPPSPAVSRTSSEQQHVDFGNLGPALGHLHMFDYPVEGIEQELDLLEYEQGALSIHDKDS